MSNVPPTGWYVEIDHPNRSTPRTPDVVGTPTINPKANSRPEVTIPVRRDETWLDATWENATARAWFDGRRLPVDELQDRTPTPGGTELTLVGGPELKKRVRVEYDQKPIDDAVRELVPAETSYAANVDVPVTETQEHVLVQEPDADMAAALNQPIPDDVPLVASGGEVTTLDASFARDILDDRTADGGSWGFDNDDAYNTGNAILLGAPGHYVEVQVTPPYDIPAADVGIQVRDKVVDDANRVNISYQWDGVEFDNNVASSIFLGWHDIGDGFYSSGTYESEVGADLNAGQTYTLRFEYQYTSVVDESITAQHDTAVALNHDDLKSGSETVTDDTGSVEYSSGTDYDIDYSNGTLTALSSGSISDGESLLVDYEYDPGGHWIGDVVAVYDKRYSFTFPNPDAAENGGGSLSGPEPKPNAVPVVFGDFAGGLTVDAGRAVVTIDDTSGEQALALSNDRGASYPVTTSNSTTVEGDFPDPGATLRLRVTLGRYGTQASFPTDGVNGHTIDAYDLYADLTNLPVVVDQRYDTALKTILTDLADKADSLWEYRLEGGLPSIEWAQTGQRVSQADTSIANYEVTTTTEDTLEKAIVRGSSTTRSGEQFVANHGVAVGLNHDELLTGKESVVDLDTGVAYERGPDYTMHYGDGTLTPVTDGGFTDGATYAITYEYKYSGEYGADGATDLTTRTFDIPGLSSDRACTVTASIIYEELKEPLQEAAITVPNPPPDWSVITAIAPDQLPGDGPWTVRELTVQGGTFEGRLGSRQSPEELVNDIRSRVQSVAERS